jgi:hypothetical protein
VLPLLWYTNIAKSFMQRLSGPPGMTMDWQGAPASPSSYTVKRILRLEIPVDTYPNVCTVSHTNFRCYPVKFNWLSISSQFPLMK